MRMNQMPPYYSASSTSKGRSCHNFGIWKLAMLYCELSDDDASTTIKMTERLGYLSTLPIHTDQQPDYDAAMQFARTHNLTFYDALYLELAIRRDAQLATLDSALSQAAAAEGLSNPSRA